MFKINSLRSLGLGQKKQKKGMDKDQVPAHSKMPPVCVSRLQPLSVMGMMTGKRRREEHSETLKPLPRRGKLTAKNPLKLSHQETGL